MSIRVNVSMSKIMRMSIKTGVSTYVTYNNSRTLHSCCYSNKTNFSEPKHLKNAIPPVSAIIADLMLQAFLGVHVHTRPVDQQQRQLVVRFYSNWYWAASRNDVLAKRFKLVSNRYTVRESANIKVCQYQIMINNDLFE